MSQILENIDDPTLGKLVERWFAWCNGDAYPARKSIEPLELGQALPFVWICEREPDLNSYRYCLVGEAVNTLYGQGLRGRSLNDFLSSKTANLLKERLDDCLEAGHLVHTIGAQTLHDKRNVMVQRLFLPMTGAKGELDTILGCTKVTDTISGRTRQETPAQKATYRNDGTRIKVGNATLTMYSKDPLY
ncbi:PAS domain-containing protein [Nisaea nitritireducens]|uniref:PAS domain-containing protein n=1 Tax=Nisaea nitritireducens TaxID=568392 RepID=UPI00186918A6|nr:PAS domain-containing protein [Nisaea nitritireducens]